MVRVFCCLLIATGLAVTPTVGLHAAGSFTPFTVDAGGAIVIPVRVNGHGPYKVIVDTGSSRSAVSSRLAAGAGAPVVARTSVVSIGQETNRLVVHLDRVEAGPAARTDILASVIPDPDLKAIAPGVDGVLGQDFLAAFDFTIDYRQRTLSWEADPALSRQADHRFKLRPEEGRFLVAIPQEEGRHRALQLVPDSGASVLVLYERDGQLPLSVGRGGRPLDVAGLSGGRRAVLSTLPELRIGALVLHDAPVVVLTGCDDVPGADGLLPLSLFDRVTFLTRAGVIVLGK
ncbi:MAG TPA: retroviral-like aspartic protease family protein [Vicinamibacterales bacterium]|nr:retroviral-like aspartic protease family protein [Vicinamibacterales bacterium]